MQSNSLGIPIAIVIAAALVAGAILYNGQNAVAPVVTNTPQEEVQPEMNVLPITEADHIKGSPNAPIVFIEYTDFDCPFCKNFHETMNRIMDEYGPDGKVAWVLRHFPLPQLHPNAIAVAAASECVAELGGNEAFWTFTDLAYSERGVNDPTDFARLPEFAATAGVDARAYQTCVESEKYVEQVSMDIQRAIDAGGNGTPHTIVMVGDQMEVVNGAQPYEVVKSAVVGLLDQIEGGNQ